MTSENQALAAVTTGPNERRLIAASLPLHNATRWTSVRKARVVTAVLGGVLTLEEARERYALSVEEFMSWQRLVVRDVRTPRLNHSTALSGLEAR